MAKDFKASQVRTTQIIASGSTSGKPALMIVSASSPGVDFDGGGINNATTLTGVGRDVFIFVSGSKSSKNSSTVQGVTVFGGDIVVSGAAYDSNGNTFGATSPGGSDKQVQFNDGGSAFGGSSGLTYDKTTNTLSVGNLIVTGTTTTVTSSNLVISDQVIYFGSGSKVSNTNGGIALASGSSVANQSLVFGRVANDTWGAGRQDVVGGTITDLTTMTLVPIRSSKFEVGGTGAFISSSIGSDLRISSTNMYLTGTVAHGLNSRATGDYAVAINNSAATGDRSFAQGSGTAGGAFSIAQGENTTTYGVATHAEGSGTTAVDDAAHAEGSLTTAEGGSSHSEGYGTYAINAYSHAEGYYTTTPGAGAHSEGYITTASGDFSHSQGNRSVSLGDYSFAGGIYTIASGSGQTVLGKYNNRNNSTSLFVVGNGSGDANSSRSDIFLIDTNTVRIGSGSSLGTDVFLFVSGATSSKDTATRGTALFGGDVVISGTLHGGSPLKVSGSMALSGSLRLQTQDSAPIVGSNESVLYVLNDGGTKKLYWKNSDNTQQQIGTGGGGATSGTFNEPSPAEFVTTASVSIAGGRGFGYTADSVGSDTYFFVSGTKDSRGTATKGTSVFGGDLVVSGSTILESSLQITGSISVANGNASNNSFALGSSIAKNGSVAIGSANRAEGTYSFALGDANTVLGGYSAAIGFFNTVAAEGDLSLAAGDGLMVSGAAHPQIGLGSPQVVVGSYNTLKNGTSLFVIGNGYLDQEFFEEVRSDILLVDFDMIRLGSGSRAATDVFLNISGSRGSRGTTTRGTTVIGGDLFTSGAAYFEQGLSGSLTKLTDGTSYLIAGNNVTITTGSSGAVTIASTGGGGGGDSFFTSTTQFSIFTTGSTAFVGTEAGIDSPQDKGADIFFYVSGSKNSKDGATPGVSMFGGDLMLSGSTYVASGSSILPVVDRGSDLGSAAKRWGNVYTGDLHLRNDRGDWTIVEEEDYLCVVNNKTGKKFKMALIPLEE